MPLTIITKHSIWDVTAALDPPLRIYAKLCLKTAISLLLGKKQKKQTKAKKKQVTTFSRHDLWEQIKYATANFWQYPWDLLLEKATPVLVKKSAE